VRELLAHRSLPADTPLIDSVIRAEGKETVLDLARAMAAGRPLASVPGICFRSERSVVLKSAGRSAAQGG
jgi:hypothetical protein